MDYDKLPCLFAPGLRGYNINVEVLANERRPSRQSVRLFLKLTKFPIAALSMLSAATGYVVALRGWTWGLLPVCLGTLLLAMGACALNEWQERDLDARMPRTRQRPIPSSAVGPGRAFALGALLVIGGIGVLWGLCGPVPAGFGCLSVLWYNGVYTPLKRLTAFAVVPGALIGALPPAIGWTAAGGAAGDPRLLAMAFFFFIWQVPHFWLLLFKHGEEYAEAGFPSLTRLFTEAQLGRLTSVWMLAAAAASLLLPLYGVSRATSTAYGLVALDAVLVALAFVVLLRPRNDRSIRSAFVGINLYACAVMTLLAADAFWRP